MNLQSLLFLFHFQIVFLLSRLYLQTLCQHLQNQGCYLTVLKYNLLLILHLLLQGEEQIDLNFIQNMVQKEYVGAEDFLPLDGEKNSSVILREGDFLICYPADGHRTAVEVDGPKPVKKAIFKVHI